MSQVGNSFSFLLHSHKFKSLFVFSVDHNTVNHNNIHLALITSKKKRKRVTRENQSGRSLCKDFFKQPKAILLCMCVCVKYDGEFGKLSQGYRIISSK